MPDPNKLEVLREARFRVLPTCRTCISFLPGSCSNWGTCRRLTYDHGKHTGEDRHPSVPPNGWCMGYATTDSHLSWLGAHNEFFDAEGICV